MTIGEYMKQKREEMNINQAEAARRIGVDRATVQRWEHDSINIDRKRIRDICRVLNIDPVIFCHPNEVIFPEERLLINAWRNADELDRAMVRRALHIGEKNDMSVSEISTTS